MTPEQRALAVDLVLARISQDDFVRRADLDPRAEPAFLAQRLEQALADRQADDVECLLLLGFAFKLSVADLGPVLARLLLEAWHRKHEDIASVLQDVRDPAAIEALAITAVAKHGYLAHDDSYGLARKCCWALADIGTPKARQCLETLAAFSDAEIAGYARRRLDKWDQELHRKRPRDQGD